MHGLNRPIEVGLSLFPGTLSHAGLTPSWDETLTVARRAEELGFDAIMVADHLLMTFPEVPERLGMAESMTVLSALAATTSRVRLAPIVAATAYRNPAMLANQAATIAAISGGRFILGLGAGWHEAEFRAYGFAFDHRVDRFEEALQIILPLLRGECVTFHGTHYRAEACELPPWGARAGSPPIMIGAKGPRMMRLAARHADIWDADRAPDCADPASLRPTVEAFETACREVGRDPATVVRSTWTRCRLRGTAGRRTARSPPPRRGGAPPAERHTSSPTCCAPTRPRASAGSASGSTRARPRGSTSSPRPWPSWTEGDDRRPPRHTYPDTIPVNAVRSYSP
jgi:alkanesulfonate monooxygenase SsuD/methylene tetrahydromethanopterin reductase-like flavin-dependent oxidoreductase (luciferase family)